MTQGTDFESLLRQALAPIEPPKELEERLENRFVSILELATEELESWELMSLTDPKNWVSLHRPVIAAAAGTAAGVGLVLVRTQRKRHKRRAASSDPLDLAERTVRDIAHEAGKLLDEASRRLR
jgi:hypothetical protein